MIMVWPIFTVLLVVMAAPVAFAGSWSGFFARIAKSLVGVILPLTFFFLSGMLAPDWKGDCQCGWISGFFVGKLALTPVVLFAAAALYRLEVLDVLYAVDAPAPRWTIIGVYCGAFASAVCLLVGFPCLDPHMLDPHDQPRLAILCYIPLWYLWRATRVRGSLWDCLWSALGMLPFWVWSLVWSHRFYLELPDKQPLRCFVVTAASHGHALLVGPQLEFEHNGEARLATRQLIRFWQVEDHWQSHSPRSHRGFRAVYNLIGPHLAARITSPWRADVVFLALSPLEWIITIFRGDG